MNRYYILTEREGLKVIEAASVNEFSPLTICFVTASGIQSFNRHELLWWSPVDSSPPAPFSNFEQLHHGHPKGILPRKNPKQDHRVAAQEAQQNRDFSLRSAAALRVLIEAVISRVPSGWRTVLLTLQVTYEGLESRYKVMHRLQNPDTGAEEMDFSDALFASINVFHRIAAEGGQNWNQSTVTIHLDDKGRRHTAKVNYCYGTNFGPR